MSLLKGAKKITRKATGKKDLSETKVNLQKEFGANPIEETHGIPVTNKEKDIISSKSLLARKQLPVLDITDVKYVIMSNEELEKEAVFEVKNKEDAGLFSVNDPRGGVVDSHVTCVTCLKDNLECSGHLGIIKLNEHIIHPIARSETLHVLQSVCGSCGGLLLPIETLRDKKILDLPAPARLKEIAELSEKVSCRRNIADKEEGLTPCIPNPTYKIDGGKVFYTRDEKSKNSSNVMTIKEIENILEGISDEDAKILGFEGDSHPRRFIMKSLAVIPLCARAPVFQEGNLWKDDLTVIYQDIARINLELGKKDLTEAERQKSIDSLLFSIEHMINNSDQKYRQLKKKPYQSLQERIQGKDGLIRESIMGKRVNFSARTVIGPDPTLKFGQIRVPRSMAPYLTQHEIIGPENIKKMTHFLRTGKVTYITPSKGRMAGRRVKVNEKLQKEHSLTLGDEIDRYLMDGDYVVFNRQPTLHKQGMMGYEVVLRDTKTIGLHLGYTKQHNAD